MTERAQSKKNNLVSLHALYPITENHYAPFLQREAKETIIGFYDSMYYFRLVIEHVQKSDFILFL